MEKQYTVGGGVLGNIWVRGKGIREEKFHWDLSQFHVGGRKRETGLLTSVHWGSYQLEVRRGIVQKKDTGKNWGKGGILRKESVD